MARKGERVEGYTSIEAIAAWDGVEEYKELIVCVVFYVAEEGSHGYFDHVTGAADPPHGPELEPVEWYIAEDYPGALKQNLSWAMTSPGTLVTVFGEDWQQIILRECEQHAVERM